MATEIYEWVIDGNDWPPKGYRTYMDDAFPIPQGWVKVADLVKPAIPAIPPPFPVLSLPGGVPLGSVPDNYGASLDGKRLTKEGQAIKDEWDHLYKAKGCTCHDGIACPHCSHPGHPYSLENNTKLWEDIPKPTRADLIMEAIRAAAGKS